MNNQREKSDARAATRARILDTFNRLLLDGVSPRPKVARIIVEAGVSRSTFYDHFDGVEVLLDESLSGVLTQLARALVIDRNEEALHPWIEHIGENRSMAREFFSGDRGERLQALFAQLITHELDGQKDSRLSGILIAGTTINALKNWTSGRLASSPSQLAQRLAATAAAILDQCDQAALSADEASGSQAT